VGETNPNLVSGLGFGVVPGDELEDRRRGGDLRFGRLQDRIPAGRAPGGEGLAEVGPGAVRSIPVDRTFAVPTARSSRHNPESSTALALGLALL